MAPQSEDDVTYAEKISKSDTRINWHNNATKIDRHIRAISPYPGAWCEMEIGGKSTRVKILASRTTQAAGKSGEVLDDDLTIACAEDAIVPTRLQKAGKQAVNLEEFLRGNKIAKGTVLS